MSMGQKPELKWVKLTELYVDQGYQRSAKSEASRRNLAYIQSNWCWAHCGALIVCYIPEKKQYAIVDGQHRYLAARARNDIEELPCLVISGHDFQQQANSFVIVNEKRVKLNSLAAFHAAVAAGDPDAVSLKEIADECDLLIPSSPVNRGETGPRQFQCVGTLVKMLGLYSRKQIIWSLTIVPEAYGETKGQMRASIIKVLAEFIKLHPDTDRERMIEVLENIEIDVMEKDARSYVGISGGSATAAMVGALERLYKNASRGRSK